MSTSSNVLSLRVRVRIENKPRIIHIPYWLFTYDKYVCDQYVCVCGKVAIHFYNVSASSRSTWNRIWGYNVFHYTYTQMYTIPEQLIFNVSRSIFFSFWFVVWSAFFCLFNFCFKWMGCVCGRIGLWTIGWYISELDAFLVITIFFLPISDLFILMLRKLRVIYGHPKIEWV